MTANKPEEYFQLVLWKRGNTLYPPIPPYADVLKSNFMFALNPFSFQTLFFFQLSQRWCITVLIMVNMPSKCRNPS